MFRKELIPLLKNHPMGLYDIAQLLETSQGDAEDDLRHLIKSLKHSDYRLIITPAYCRKCWFRNTESRNTGSSLTYHIQFL